MCVIDMLTNRVPRPFESPHTYYTVHITVVRNYESVISVWFAWTSGHTEKNTKNVCAHSKIDDLSVAISILYDLIRRSVCNRQMAIRLWLKSGQQRMGVYFLFKHLLRSMCTRNGEQSDVSIKVEYATPGSNVTHLLAGRLVGWRLSVTRTAFVRVCSREYYIRELAADVVCNNVWYRYSRLLLRTHRMANECAYNAGGHVRHMRHKTTYDDDNERRLIELCNTTWAKVNVNVCECVLWPVYTIGFHW